MSTSAKSIWIILAAIGLVGASRAAPVPTTAQIIAKARGYLGSDAALDAVKSVHFIGTMVTAEPSPDGPKQVSSGIDIIFQKPYRQRIMLTTPTTVQVTGLDDYDAWQRIQERDQAGRRRLALLQPEMIKKLRANTWENLNFYRGIEKRGGHVQVIGPATVDGVATVKVIFAHEPGITFVRFFDLATGRLVLTETDRGDRIREEGDVMVQGLRFPQKVTSVASGTDAAGKPVENRTVITFERITVNEVFPDGDFEVPMIPDQEPAPAVATPPVVPPAAPPGATTPAVQP